MSILSYWRMWEGEDPFSHWEETQLVLASMALRVCSAMSGMDIAIVFCTDKARSGLS